MNNFQSGRNNVKVFGAILIGLGIVLLIGQLSGFEFPHGSFVKLPWPSYVIIPGVALLVMGAMMGRNGLWIMTLGAVTTTTGLILSFQAYTDAYRTWAYAWALVVPTSIGL